MSGKKEKYNIFGLPIQPWAESATLPNLESEQKYCQRVRD